MRLNIVHKTGFRYASPVRASYNEARMTPSANATQTVWSSRLSIEPAAWSISYTDYWGTAVTTFEVHERHSRLTVRSQAVVETRGDGLPWDTDRRVPASDLGWAALQDRGVTDSMSEFLTVNERTTAPDELLELARGVSDQAPRLAGLDVCRLVADRLSYRRGSTAVTSTAREVWQGGSGVCQDYSHVALGALRSIGLPARYVSGYLLPLRGDHPERDRRGRVALVGGVVVRQLGGLRPDPAAAAVRALRPGRSRSRLRRRGPAARHVLRWRLGHVRHRGDDPARLIGRGIRPRSTGLSILLP